MGTFNHRNAAEYWKKSKSWYDHYGIAFNRKKGDKPKRYSVECGEDVHCISLMPNGAISLHNHKDKMEVETLVTHDKLAYHQPKDSKLPTCLKLVRFLRDRVKIGSTYMVEREWGIESHLAELITSIDQRRGNKEQFHAVVNPDTSPSFREAYFKKLEKDLSISWTDGSLLSGYRTPPDSTKPTQISVEFTNQFHGFPTVQAEQIIKKGRFDRENYARIKFTLPQRWFMAAFTKKRYVINGFLVMDVIKEFPNHTFLCTIAKPGHGYKVSAKQAVVDFERERLSWVNDENKVSALMEGHITPRKRRTKAEMEAAKGPIETKEV